MTLSTLPKFVFKASRAAVLVPLLLLAVACGGKKDDAERGPGRR